ncbi:MAG: hypothetical protein MW690_001488 [Methanophagales archaeon]|nr:hypothetical protein [Methanophagales archaeon]
MDYMLILIDGVIDALLENFFRFLANIVSYGRILALALCHAALIEVFILLTFMCLKHGCVWNIACEHCIPFRDCSRNRIGGDNGGHTHRKASLLRVVHKILRGRWHPVQTFQTALRGGKARRGGKRKRVKREHVLRCLLMSCGGIFVCWN